MGRFPTLLRDLVPLSHTHITLPQTVFRAGVSTPPDLLRFVAALNKPKDTCCVEKGDKTFVLSTLEQAQQILQDNTRVENNERPVGISLYSKYSSILRLNMVKHIYYLPSIQGRLPESVNLVEDGIPFHYLLNPSAPMTEIDIVRKEYERITEVTPLEHSKSHEEYLKFLAGLPAGAITPWRKVPLYGSKEAQTDVTFIKNYGEVLPPASKSSLRAQFSNIMNAVPADVLPIIEMCQEKALKLFAFYEKTVNDVAKDTIGLEITRVFDVARNTAITYSAFSTPQPASYSSASPHSYSPIFRDHPFGVRLYSTSSREYNPLIMLSPDVVKEFRDYFINLWHEQGENEEKAVDLADEVYRLSFFIEKIDACGVFGKTPCPRDGGWGW